MDAVLTYWRDPSQVKPCAQAAIINMELAALRSSVVQAAEAHRRGRRVGAPTQLGTAAVNYMTDVFDGRCHVANIVTLSQAPKCGWETWFACTYAEDVAKLRMPDDLRSAKGKNMRKVEYAVRGDERVRQGCFGAHTAERSPQLQVLHEAEGGSETLGARGEDCRGVGGQGCPRATELDSSVETPAKRTVISRVITTRWIQIWAHQSAHPGLRLSDSSEPCARLNRGSEQGIPTVEMESGDDEPEDLRPQCVEWLADKVRASLGCDAPSIRALFDENPQADRRLPPRCANRQLSHPTFLSTRAA